MSWILLLSALCLTHVKADQFNPPDPINNFTIHNSNFYVATPSTTYLLDSSLNIKYQFSKEFTASSFLYVDSNVLLECGVRKTNTTACCYLTNSSNLVQLSDNSSDHLCDQFTKVKFYYPCYDGKNQFYLIISFYKYTNTGAFVRLWFKDILSTNKLSFVQAKFNSKISSEYRAQVVSPAEGKLKQYVVLKKTNKTPQSVYMNPDLEIDPQNLIALLKCDGNSTNVHLGFGISDTASDIGNIIDLSKMTHFVMYESNQVKYLYRICSFTEGTEMKKHTDNSSLEEVSKSSLISINTGGKEINSLNGMVVNDGLVVYYSVGKDLYKLVITKGDQVFRELGKVFTATGDIKKMQFMSANLGYVSTSSSIESFIPYRCSDYTDCTSCTQLKDPHCGWCILENRCSVKSECRVDSTLWTQEETKCLAISVDANNGDVVAGQTLTLTYENVDLPQDILLTCKFTSARGEEFQSNGTVTDKEIYCDVPAFTDVIDGLLPVSVGVYYLTEQLATVNIKYHQCDLYQQCSECSGISKFCTWCPLEGQCSTQNSAVCVEYKVEDPTRCPSITKTQPVKLSCDTIKQIIVDVENLPNYQVSSVYQCKITSKINTTHSRVFDIGSAESTNSSIFCKDVQIGRSFPECNMTESDVTISIIYRAADVVSGVDVVSAALSVYSCQLLGADCVQCVSTYSTMPYSCRFCENKCAYTNSPSCDVSSVNDVDQCFTANTKISEVTPNWAPGEGGVSITIKGTSLAKSGLQIEIQFVFSNGDGTESIVDCITPTIKNSTTLTCTTPNIMTALKLASLHVEEHATIRLRYINSAIGIHTSDKTFTFAPLQISTVSPLVGPQSGGTVVAINGSKICIPYQTAATFNKQNCKNARCDAGSQILTCETPAGQGVDTPISVLLGDSTITATYMFSYGEDPIVTSVRPNCTLAKGGMNITVIGSNFNLIQRPLLVIRTPTIPTTKRSIDHPTPGDDADDNADNDDKDDAEDADTGKDEVTPPSDYFIEVEEKKKDEIVKCGDDASGGFTGTAVTAVEFSDTTLVYTMPNDMPHSYQYGFKMDNVESLCTTPRTMEVISNPSVISINFENNNTLTCTAGEKCYINITMTQIHRFENQVKVIVGKMACLNASISIISRKKGQIGDLGRFVCVVPSVQQIKESLYKAPGLVKRSLLGEEVNDKYPVRLQISNYRKEIGWVVFTESGFPMKFVYIGAGGLLFLVLIIIISLAVKNWKDKRHMIVMEKKHQKEMNKVEASYAKAARQEFTELTLMTDHTAHIKIDPLEIPYRIFSDYLVHIMFPNVDKRKILSNLQLDQCDEADYQLQEFYKFLRNDLFVVKFIDIIERQREFQIAHRCEVASYLTIALYSDFNYLSHVLFLLLDKIIAADVHKSPKLLLRSTKSVAEKLLTNWLSLALHNYLYTVTGPPLYELCYKINVTVEQGPLDFVTHQARFALSQDRILSEEMEYKVLEVEAEGPDGSRAKSPVSVLDCDTISQVKGKLYRAIYRHQPYSQQPSLDALSVLWTPASGQGPGNMELCDFDDRMADLNVEKQFNTLKTYKVATNDLLKLTLFNDYHQAPMSTIRSAKRQTVSEICRCHLVKGNNSDMDFRSPAPNKRNTNTVTTTKIASEAFLPSLIRTKEHLGKVLDSMMGTIFMESNNIPAPIKFLFDYLDEKTVLLSERDRGDAEIAHVWKTNSLPLRFWINIIKNPQFLFDIEKPPIMDSYLSVIGQCFMDSFSLATMTLNKDSSANKLVYNREVNIYRSKVDKWYKDVRQSPQVSIRTVTAESKLPAKLPFSSKFAVSQLFKYAQKYQIDIASALPTQGQTITRSDFEVLMKPR